MVTRADLHVDVQSREKGRIRRPTDDVVIQLGSQSIERVGRTG